MTNAIICYCLFRVALPLTLAFSIACRFNLFSFVYALLLLVLPLLPSPTSSAIKGHTGRYLKSVVALSGLICAAHLIFQATLLGLKPYGHFIINCNSTEELLRHVGLHRLDDAKALDVSRLVIVDFLVFIVSIVVLGQCQRYQKNFEERKRAAEEEKEEQEERDKEGSDREDRSRRDEGSDFEDYQSAFDAERKRRRHEKANALLHAFQNFAVVFFIAAAAIIHPSVTSAIYFLSFIAVTTWWACYKKLGFVYAILRIFLLIYSGLHFVVLYLYQLPYSQHILRVNTLYARIFGLNQLTSVNCNDPRRIIFEDLSWAVFLNPAFIFLMYWSLAAATRSWLSTPASKKTVEIQPVEHMHEPHLSDAPQRRKSSRRPPSRKQSGHHQEHGSDKLHFGKRKQGEIIPLLESDYLRKRTYKSMKRGSSARKPHDSTVEVDPNGSIIWSSDTFPYGEGSTVTNSKFRQIFSPVVSFFSIIARQSYIATLIIMMAWGITYHSWLTFVLLLWSCILWMVPNSRKACLYGSPFLVMYAITLLIIQFIYGLDLTDAELPQKIESVNLGQIGLVKYRHLPVLPLAIKILYSVMFWITLRQHTQERFTESHRNIDGATAQHSSVGFGSSRLAAIKDGNGKESKVSNPLMKSITEFVMDLLTKYWIWVVACMLMVISLGGDVVVLYRVFYMGLFLFFIVMFQISYKWWRKLMYGFWLTVIVYSMLVLILIYTYQFEHFPDYWKDYIGVSIKFQHDIGLQVYDTGTLFIQLLTPTFFLIITIIQLHYFHKDFLKISDIEHFEKSNADEEAKVKQGDKTETVDTKVIIEEEGEVSPSTSQGAVVAIPEESDDKTKKEKSDNENDDDDDAKKEKKHETMKEMLHRCGQCFMKNGYVIYDYGSNLIWRFLEVHMIKIVLFAIMALSTYDVCAVHFIFVCFVVLSLPIRGIRTLLSHCCTIWASVLLLARMIYQLSFVGKHGGWETNCTGVENINTTELPYPFNETVDNGFWMGFKKTNDLADYCKGYIGLILVLSIQAVVKIRQHIFRIKNNEPEPKPGVIFNDVTRVHADAGVLECLQYFLNYFFYKFGVEFCFVTIVACIGVRLDVYAVISALFLCSVFLLRRRTLAKIWPFYVAYLCIFIPIQYIMVIGIPPGVCIDYPWDSVMDPELRDWLFLPHFIYPPNSYKILVSFFELLFVCCQLHVFFIEKAPNAELYEGGSNKEIYYESDNSNVIVDPMQKNPVPDFVTYTTSYLDMIKVVLFFAFYWISLAILFQAGTTRVSFFAMGYVIGCFLFLWNGNEFYLKPMKVLIRLWNLLLMYNVFVILIKSILQVIGCVFLRYMHENFCWIVQLLGIACLKKLQRDNTLDTDVNLMFDDACKVPVDEAGLLWDGICFGFLLLQKRLFGSFYFQHIINEIRAQQQLASRGAELINERMMKEVREQQAEEKKVVETIKSKMDRIRAKQQKLRGSEVVDPQTHFEAIRAGDYYLFDDLDDDTVDPEISKITEDAAHSDEEEDQAQVKQMGLNALLSHTLKTDMKTAVKESTVKGSSPDKSDSQAISRQTSTASKVPLSQKTSLSTRFETGPSKERPEPPDSLPSLKKTYQSDDHEMPPPDDVPPTASLSDVRPDLGEQEDKDRTFAEKVKTVFMFLKAFLLSLIISLTAKLNSISKDYRYVSQKLSKEKKLLKEQLIKSTCSESPASGSFPDSEKSEEIVEKPSTSQEEVALIKDGKASGNRSKSDELCASTPDSDQEKEFQSNRPPLVLFFVAIYYSILSRSEIICYIVIVINQIKSASVLSLPLPLMAFLWGTLSVPRPSKTFWITIVTYTEAVVVLKYLFQFDFFPWTTDIRYIDPFWAPRILGIEKKENYAVYDLTLLLVVFFHRFMMKSMGLWNISLKSMTSISDSKEDEVKADESMKAEKVALPEEEEEDQGDDANKKERDEGDDDAADEDINVNEDEEKAKFTMRALLDLPKAIFSGAFAYVEPFKAFFDKALNPDYRVTVDVYFYMIICDLLTFLVVVFGYSAFGTNSGDQGVASYFADNKIPVPFLVMLIVQFGLIVVDRALYLRKHILGKLIFQLVLVVFVHMWMFFILPAISEREFSSTVPPQLWYFTKCIYFLLSAYQIRCGYPTRILGNFLCKKYNYLNFFLYKGFMFVPFLYELRALMDWIWTDTSLSISNWFKMEDIYSNIFQLKCQRRFEDEYPSPRGEGKPAYIKYGVGGFLLFIVIGIIWFPLVLFALGNTVGVTNLPFDCTVQVSFGGYEPIFKMSAQQGSLAPMSEKMYDDMLYAYRTNRNAQAFLANYERKDITVAQLSGDSTALWAISPPSQSEMIKDLIGQHSMTLRILYQFSRESGSVADKIAINEKSITLEPNTTLRYTLADMLNGTISPDKTARIPKIIPKLLRVPGRGKPTFVKQLMQDEKHFSSLFVQLKHGNFMNFTSQSEWWEVREDCSESDRMFSFLKRKDCSYIQLIAFNDKVFPSELSILSGRGIIGLYTTIVLLLGRLFRSFIAGLSYTIMFDDMPNVDRILQLCMDIYLVRESNELALEEDLFAKLIFLYRSPETLIKWTRYPENRNR